MPDRIDARISFDPEREIMEADFSDLTLASPDIVNRFYDRLEARIAETGQQKWFFLVNYANCRIMPEAWLAHSLRGRRLNMAHSLGTVRYDATPETRAEIERRAGTDAFDPNLFETREGGLARIAELDRARPHWQRRRVLPRSQHGEDEIRRRIAFDAETRVMEVDFSDFDIDTNADVHAVYNHIEARIAETGRTHWYFLVNYSNCRIDLRAWLSFSQRGERLNLGHSLGSVRYGLGSDTEVEMRDAASRKDFTPNIRATRAEALARIAEMRAGASVASERE